MFMSRAAAARAAFSASCGHNVIRPLVSELVRGRPGVNRGDRGATAVEYAILVSMIALVIVASVTLFGKNVIDLFAVPSDIFQR